MRPRPAAEKRLALSGPWVWMVQGETASVLKDKERYLVGVGFPLAGPHLQVRKSPCVRDPARADLCGCLPQVPLAWVVGSWAPVELDISEISWATSTRASEKR